MDRLPASPRAHGSTQSSPTSVGNAFGLSLEADLPVLGLDRQETQADLPRTELRRVAPESIDAAWPSVDVERRVDHRFSDGRVMMTVDAHPRHGHRIEAPDHGRFRVSGDGSLVECAPAEGPWPSWRWHRPFFAQALPMAAALNGLEILHASGVVIDGNAIAFVGHSGAGKTSLAIHLVDQGASLLADDVVALSPIGGKVHAHPGVRFANIAEEQIDDIADDRRARLGRVVGRSEKLHILVNSMVDAPAPLSALYFLDRRKTVRGLGFERLSPDPRWLFGATYMTHLTTSARMKAQLEVGSLIANQVATFRLCVPPHLSAAELAPLVAAHSRQVPRP
jgi:hypothetical protein